MHFNSFIFPNRKTAQDKDKRQQQKTRLRRCQKNIDPIVVTNQ